MAAFKRGQPPRGPMTGGGPPPQAQVDATLAWVTERFRHHYRTNPPDLPPRFGRREFGFIWIGKKFFLRHLGFGSRSEFHHFLAREAPHHAYYSTAYYKTPGAPTMREKEWLGADLIFDLDADHLPGADKMSFEAQLVEVKKQAHKLLHEYLLGDFGFDPEHVRVVFSGGRGYHFHVSDPRVLAMDSAMRREVVDYVSPNDTVSQVLYENWVKERGYDKDNFGIKKTKVVKPVTTPGWNGRITRTVADQLEAALRLPEREAVGILSAMEGIGPKTAKEILRHLTPERIMRIREGYLDQFQALARPTVVKGLIELARIHAPGETDEPVTADIKRLIRLPGSIHGKTGLRVTPLTIEEFAKFDPLRDAVALSDEPVRVVVSKPEEVALNGRRFTPEPGEQELPEYAAMFLALRRRALLPLAEVAP